MRFSQIFDRGRLGLCLLVEYNLRRAITGPRTVTLAMTERCNLRCIMCNSIRAYEKAIRVKPDMTELTTQEFCRLVDDLSKLGVKSVILGGGEPFLREDALAIIEKIKKGRLGLHIVTNGTLLNRGSISWMVEVGVDSISFSLDAPEPGLNDRIRGLGSFAATKKSIETLIQQRGEAKRPRVGIQMCVMSLNVGKMSEFVRFATDLGVESVSFQLVNTSRETLVPDRDDILRQISVVDSLRAGLSLEIPDRNYLNTFDVHRVQRNASVPCFVPWLQSNVTSTGDVIGCWRLPSTVGNLREKSFAEIWYSSRYNDFRSRVLKGEFKYCAICSISCYTPENQAIMRVLNRFRLSWLVGGVRK